MSIDFVKQIRFNRLWMVLVAVVIAFGSLFISHSLIRDLSEEERVSMEVWAEAMRGLQVADDTSDLTMVLKVLNANHTIPVVVADKSGDIQTYRNIELSEGVDTATVLLEHLRHFKSDGNVLQIDLSGDGTDYWQVCYGSSLMLHRLEVYPYVQLFVVVVFVLIAIFALLSSKKAEQNKVWVGLSKETAHQLGTPISSLMAWTELLKVQYPNDDLILSLQEDVERLQMIANRFSKVGSVPEVEDIDLRRLLERVTEYIRHRTSSKVKISLHIPDSISVVKVNGTLFEWVIENLCKNAIDAMDGAGSLTLIAGQMEQGWFIEVSDTGKGIEHRYFKSIFNPGFTTKKRGWGLGLSLAKRIVEEYHSGRIFVKESVVNQGTTIRIELKK